MRAAFLKAPFRVEFRDVAEPEPGPGQVLLRPKLVGICGTDIQRARSLAKDWERFGHELVAEVVGVGDDVDGLVVGDTVAAQVRAACGYCRGCLMGRMADCTNRARTLRLDFFAERVAVDRRIVWKTNGIPDRAAVLLEPMGMAFDINRLAEVGLESSVAIVGPGPIGMLAVRVAKLRGARRIIVVGTAADASRFALCEQLGATACISRDDGDPVAAVLELTGGEGVHAVMNTATVRSVQDSLLMCRFGGIVVFMGEAAGGGRPTPGVDGPGAVPIDVDWIHHNRLQLRGSWAAPNGLLPLGAQLLADGEFPYEQLVNAQFAWGDLEQALLAVAERRDGVVKAAVTVGADV
ncbi:zinc-binding dehydrogenase [Conexibacter sp. CPCC 206217]|uniref:zinc-dependent alcohol dehydrogenase n=1 Tax=Conexibacter sp. CPCC 206217 TaxID=3064574 RepID=UPI0027186B65|nr:zinc-binding dehydrogenase [Conexibacter sp. CPCC 206217]MDO8209622.1 zinc-binding dehydrogenase [Conexibacter sp. CPCC 206217]